MTSCKLRLRRQSLNIARCRTRVAVPVTCRTAQVQQLLFADYPTGTSSAYDPAKYAFCFSCHAERIVRERYVDQRIRIFATAGSICITFM